MTGTLPISVVIPTYRREEALIASIESLLHLESGAAEIIVVDQSPTHLPSTEARLREWNESGRIRWMPAA